jgi:outer membrane protein TolC
MKHYACKTLLPLLFLFVLAAAPCLLRAGETSPSGGAGENEPGPSPAGVASLSLAECVRIALDRNPARRAAAAGVEMREEHVGLSRSSYYPQVSFSTGYRRFDSHVFLPAGVTALAGSDTLGARDDWQASLSGSLTVYDNGRRRAELEAALAEKDISVAEAEIIRQDLILNVHQAFYSLLAARAEAAARRQSLERRRENLRLVEIRAGAGDAPEADIIRARVEVGDARLMTVRADSRIRTAEAALNAAMGLPVHLPVRVADQDVPAAMQPGAIELSSALENALERRPVLHRARLQTVAAGREVAAVKGSYGPRLQANIRYGRRDEEFLPEDDEWAAGLALEIPVFTGFARRHEIAGAMAKQARSDAELDALGLSVQEETAAAYSELLRAAEEVRTTTLLEADARESLRRVRRSYEAGAATINDLLDVEAALSRAEADHARAVYAHHAATSGFQRATGNI